MSPSPTAPKPFSETWTQAITTDPRNCKPGCWLVRADLNPPNNPAALAFWSKSSSNSSAFRASWLPRQGTGTCHLPWTLDVLSTPLDLPVGPSGLRYEKVRRGTCISKRDGNLHPELPTYLCNADSLSSCCPLACWHMARLRLLASQSSGSQECHKGRLQQVVPTSESQADRSQNRSASVTGHPQAPGCLRTVGVDQHPELWQTANLTGLVL